MNYKRMMLSCLIGLGITALAINSLANGQEVKGQLKIGLHKVKLDQGKLYQITLSGPPSLHVEMTDGELMRRFGANPADDKLFFMPKRTDEYSFVVTFGAFGFGARPTSDTIDYTLKFAASEIDAQPLLSSAEKLTDNDPVYKDKNKHFKPYKIQMSAGKVYIIDLVKDGVRDPYLFLEDPKGQIVASDDDGGGDLNSRIIFAPTQSGEYTIIATTLGKETGGFTLTVRGSK